ncbi:hypothetical protein ACIBO5_21840 [Nonomuraea angiospora]|uniref:hypothetical protein n=1 Tax=Nonomuraea angiospora TaxID=46172 RepID=UPI0029A738A4|nr:hypothetical protein [Nonomuraea angiospora]MDX3103821.1 hypothetical protein [Nonomuraea angiospora]
MLAMGAAEALILAVWAVLAMAFFFLIYWAIRLAIRHERRRTLAEVADQEQRNA